MLTVKRSSHTLLWHSWLQLFDWIGGLCSETSSVGDNDSISARSCSDCVRLCALEKQKDEQQCFPQACNVSKLCLWDHWVFFFTWYVFHLHAISARSKVLFCFSFFRETRKLLHWPAGLSSKCIWDENRNTKMSEREGEAPYLQVSWWGRSLCPEGPPSRWRCSSCRASRGQNGPPHRWRWVSPPGG